MNQSGVVVTMVGVITRLVVGLPGEEGERLSIPRPAWLTPAWLTQLHSHLIYMLVLFFFFFKHLDAFSSLGLAHPRRRGREQQRMRWLDNITDWMDMSLSKLGGNSGGQGSLVYCSPWSCKRIRHDFVTEQQHPSSWVDTGVCTVSSCSALIPFHLLVEHPLIRGSLEGPRPHLRVLSLRSQEGGYWLQCCRRPWQPISWLESDPNG